MPEVPPPLSEIRLGCAHGELLVKKARHLSIPGLRPSGHCLLLATLGCRSRCRRPLDGFHDVSSRRFLGLLDGGELAAASVASDLGHGVAFLEPVGSHKNPAIRKDFWQHEGVSHPRVVKLPGRTVGAREPGLPAWLFRFLI